MSLIERAAQQIDLTQRVQLERPYKGDDRRNRGSEFGGSPPKDSRLSSGQPRSTAARGLVAEPTSLSLPFKDLAKRGFITPNGRRSRLSEEVRLVKRQLMRQMELDDGGMPTTNRTIVVTSARPGEGKSFVALNLALSFAIDERIPVLLVDADYARSACDDLLHVPRSPGLLETLLDNPVPLNAVIRRDAGLPFAYMPPGSSVASATNLYAGSRMAALLHDACEACDSRVVIVDGPSVLSTTEAIVLASQANDTLLVVDADHTSKSTLEAALDLLAPCKSVSLVLNMAARDAAEHFGRYYVPGFHTSAALAGVGVG